MKLAKKAYLVALIIMAFAFAVSAQTTQTDSTARPEKDPRNTAPTVGTGGTPGGPTGLFTIYDGQVLRKGEFTFSAALSNYDRDPGNVDISDVPLSFQVGLSNHVELFFNTNAYRGIKVNNPAALSSFYLPNSQLVINGALTSPAAIVLAPQGTANTQFSGQAVYRPAGTQPFIQYPFVGANAGTFGFSAPLFAGTVFGFPTTTATLGANGSSGNAAANFPGIGSVYGSILPGIVLQTRSIAATTTVASATVPTVFTTAPVYLPDAPFVNRTYGTSAFNEFVVGGKIRLNSINSPYGLALVPFYRFYADKANDFSGFNQLQRGASPGGSRGDFGMVLAADARLAKYANLSGNVGYIYNSSVKGDFAGGKFTLLDRGDEFNAGVGMDFPVNKYFQPILEAKMTKYVGGRTPNAFENDPIDALAGVRIFPTRYLGMSFAYRYHANQQDASSFDNNKAFTSTAAVVSPTGTTQTFNTTTSAGGVPPGFIPSSDPHGYIVQFFVGRRNKRQAEITNLPANVTALNVSQTNVTIGCAPGFQPAEGTTCSDSQTVSVSTTAVDPENDVLTYNYTVSGGRVTGQGANVSWDLTGVKPGTYTITSGVDDGCGVCGQTKTQTVTVAECNCVPIPPTCDCPTISVAGPAGVTNAGTPVTFTANVNGGSQSSQTYNWTVSAGTITSGQGTSSISVDTTGLDGQNVTATVDVGGLCASCTPTDSETAGIAAPSTYNKIDEFGAAPDDDVKARVDNFYIQLQNDPNAQGYIINYGTPKEIAKRKAQINKAIKFLQKDSSRVIFVDGGDQGTGVNTKFFVVPSGVTPPTADSN